MVISQWIEEGKIIKPEIKLILNFYIYEIILNFNVGFKKQIEKQKLKNSDLYIIIFFFL